MARRKSGRWKPKFKPWTWRKVKPNLEYMRAWEEEIIMRDILLLHQIAERPFGFTAATLMDAAPGRYHPQHLGKALKRLAEQKRLKRGSQIRVGFSRSRQWSYKLREGAWQQAA